MKKHNLTGVYTVIYNCTACKAWGELGDIKRYIIDKVWNKVENRVWNRISDGLIEETFNFKW